MLSRKNKRLAHETGPLQTCWYKRAVSGDVAEKEGRRRVGHGYDAGEVWLGPEALKHFSTAGVVLTSKEEGPGRRWTAPSWALVGPPAARRLAGRSMRNDEKLVSAKQQQAAQAPEGSVARCVTCEWRSTCRPATGCCGGRWPRRRSLLRIARHCTPLSSPLRPSSVVAEQETHPRRRLAYPSVGSSAGVLGIAARATSSVWPWCSHTPSHSSPRPAKPKPACAPQMLVSHKRRRRTIGHMAPGCRACRYTNTCSEEGKKTEEAWPY